MKPYQESDIKLDKFYKCSDGNHVIKFKSDGYFSAFTKNDKYGGISSFKYTLKNGVLKLSGRDGEYEFKMLYGDPKGENKNLFILQGDGKNTPSTFHPSRYTLV